MNELADTDRKSLLDYLGVIGIGMGKRDNGESCINVYVKSSDWIKALPKTYLTYPIVVEVVGEVIAAKQAV